jgi:cyclophilin family peptidyl-prolyl cis-trans isomerase
VRRRAHVLHGRLSVPEGQRRAAFARALQQAGAPEVRGAALAAFAASADTADLPALLDLYDRARDDTLIDLALGAATAIAAVQQQHGTGAAAFFARFGPPDATPRRASIEGRFPQPFRWPAAPPRPLDDYRAMVTRWVVPEYAGRPRPRARWQTPRGTIDIELHAGDAPIATTEFARLTASGGIAGTEFFRVVPVFVAQQTGVSGAVQQREETNRHRLAAGTMSWANAGYDRGMPGYTLGVTPQPHNEGEFTALGHVVAGMDVLGRLQVGDRVTSARLLPAPAAGGARRTP